MAPVEALTISITIEILVRLQKFPKKKRSAYPKLITIRRIIYNYACKKIQYKEIYRI